MARKQFIKDKAEKVEKIEKIEKVERVTRVRYSEQDGVLSSQPMFAKTQMVKALIDIKHLRYQIINDKNQVLLKEEFESLSKAKKEVKDSLKSLGVQFHDEVRATKQNFKNLFESRNREQDILDFEMKETEAWLMEDSDGYDPS